MSPSTHSIRVWDRREEREIEERIYGERGLRWLYETLPGRLVGRALAGPGFSTLLGAFYDSGWSTRSIRPFIRDYAIRMDEFIEQPWSSFNDFFVRKFRRGARPFARDAERLPAFAEGRYLGWRRIVPEQSVPVKGAWVRPQAVLRGGDADTGAWTGRFDGGPLLIARLCPTDYHRYHYPDGGDTKAAWRVGGCLHSVHPIALRARGDVFVTNERRVAVLQTRQFGLLAYVEVGAMGVGRIVQTHPEGRGFERGDEKGMFRFGASTVMLYGEPGRWAPDDDVLERTLRGVESFVRLGEGVGRAVLRGARD